MLANLRIGWVEALVSILILCGFVTDGAVSVLQTRGVDYVYY